MNWTIKTLRLIPVLMVLLIIVFSVNSATARDVVPAPPGGGPGLSVHPEDNVPLPAAESIIALDDGIRMPSPPDIAAMSRLDDIGGDDLHVQSGTFLEMAMDIAPNGDIYLAHSEENESDDWVINVWRSTDAGVSFSLWGTLAGAGGEYYTDPDLRIVDGTQPVCMIVYGYDDHIEPAQIRLVSSSLGSTADFGTETVIMSEAGVNFSYPSFDTDVSSYASFYVYVVASGSDGTGRDIWFARSIDQGATFESPYMIADLLVNDRMYLSPDISYGFGGHLHVVWWLHFTDDFYDSSVRYRHASTFANGGLAGWDYWVSMTSATDGIDDRVPVVHAARASSDVFIGYSQFSIDPLISIGSACFVSSNSGSTFGPSATISGDTTILSDVAENPDTGVWYLSCRAGHDYGFSNAHVSDLTAWSPLQLFNDVSYDWSMWHGGDIALDPTHSNLPAMAWIDGASYGVGDILFDAAWRDDPGWPNQEPGLPIDLPAAPISPPALADVDGDSDLEIVFSDELRQIQVINPDGSSVPGWPVDVGVDLSDGPVAIGDLNGDGEPTLVVGGTDGKAYAYDPRGDLLPGWPSEITIFAADVYVSIGALGPPYPRTVVCVADRVATFRNHHGVRPPGAYDTAIGSSVVAAPAAIGDIDGDGVAEIVCGLESTLYARERDDTSLEFGITLPAPLSDAVTLGDLDLDGDLEILCPTETGVLYAYGHTGTSLGGNFPYDTADVGPLTSAAIANFRGDSTPDLAFAHRDWTVHALYGDGSVISAYPVNTTSYWHLRGAPVIDSVNGLPGDVVIGDRGDQAWAWTNTGYLLDGWSHDMQDQVNLSPAIGDIDLDGSNELVMLTDTQLHVMDLNSTPGSGSWNWPMYGHDAQRTGCSDCVEDLVTAVDDGAAAITRVSFVGPSPNPVSGITQFAFAVPLRAAVNLEIIDLRGRRVATVTREEMDPGSRVVSWHGQDATGRPVAAGQYFARLRVRGPGLDEELTRKLIVVR
jgi:hypothetical protein